MNKLALELYQLYWEDLYSLADIAELHSVSPMTIWHRMKKQGIRTRTSSEALKVERCRIKKRDSRLRFHEENPNFMKKENAPCWKGGRTNKDGYILIKVYDHPNANNKGYVREGRLVMEKKLGRYLTKKEVVLHLDKNGSNNEPENLKLFKNQSELMKHMNGRK